jgi:hypothetical protein
MSENRPEEPVEEGSASTWSIAERDFGESEGRSTGVRIKAFSDSLRSFCGSCTHSRFIHSDDGSRCLYSECACARFTEQALVETG